MIGLELPAGGPGMLTEYGVRGWEKTPAPTCGGMRGPLKLSPGARLAKTV